MVLQLLLQTLSQEYQEMQYHFWTVRQLHLP